MMDYQREIIEKELARMRKAYNDAHERYAYGSRSADKTMEKYDVLIPILEKALEAGSEGEV